jgi:hypothetical protein
MDYPPGQAARDALQCQIELAPRNKVTIDKDKAEALLEWHDEIVLWASRKPCENPIGHVPRRNCGECIPCRCKPGG